MAVALGLNYFGLNCQKHANLQLGECETTGFNLDVDTYDENPLYAKVTTNNNPCYPTNVQVYFPGVGHFVTSAKFAYNPGFL